MGTLYFEGLKGNHLRMKTVVSEDGRVTIPKAIRRRLGIVPGTVLAFAEEEGRLVAVKEQQQQDAFCRWRGKGRLPSGMSVDEYLGIARDTEQ